MSTMQSEISRSYNSFAGSDIKAVIGQFQFAELQAVSYAITREKAPVYTMGSPDPRSYSRNKRGIAGNLIWINFVKLKDILCGFLFDCFAGYFWGDWDMIPIHYTEYKISYFYRIWANCVF